MALLESDQVAGNWDSVVGPYEKVFEPFTLALTEPILDRLGPLAGQSILDVGAGSGGAALALSGRGARVTAVDVSAAMVTRIAERATGAGVRIDGRVMDAAKLDFPDGCFDAALSAFGIVLLPDAVSALAEMRRVVRTGGRIAIVTWTEPQNYELAAAVAAAADAVVPDRPRPPLPAQLRYREPGAFRDLMEAAGLFPSDLVRVTAVLEAASPRALVQQLAFAPGMAAMMGSFGDRRAAVEAALEAALVARFGAGPVRLGGVAHAAIAVVPRS